MSQLPILYTFVRCPWAMRARLALAYKGIEYETREVDLKNKPQALLEISPKGTVPVLVFPNGKILEESIDIVRWAMPKPEPEQAIEIDNLIYINDNYFKLNNNGYKYPERNLQEGRTQGYYRQQCEIFIQNLEQRLNLHKYLISNEISIADLAIFPLIRQFSMVDSQWFSSAPYPKVWSWLNTIISSEFYENAMRKSPAWQA